MGARGAARRRSRGDAFGLGGADAAAGVAGARLPGRFAFFFAAGRRRGFFLRLFFGRGGRDGFDRRFRGRGFFLSVVGLGDRGRRFGRGKRFDRFHRGRSDRSAHGYGLGLPIVAAIARAHHGRVFLEQPPDGDQPGVVFVLDLPLVGAGTEADDDEATGAGTDADPSDLELAERR